MEQRIMRVTGKGRLRLKPDVTRITMTLEGTLPEYEETLKRSSEDTEGLRTLMAELGFAGSDLKTVSFQVDPVYESVQDEHHNYKQQFVGYQFTHVCKVEFDSDNTLLGKVLYGLANASVSPQFVIGYTVKDTEEAKNALLGKAVADAKAKAQVLAQAAGVTLKDIQKIDYSWGELDLEVNPMRRMTLAKSCAVANSYDMNIEPDDIQVSDTVTVEWEIEG